MGPLRFVLDNDVDIDGCTRVLAAQRHQVMTAFEAGVHEDDGDVLVYAIDRRAAVVTHDAEFARSQRRRQLGQLVRIAVHAPQAADHLAWCLDSVVDALRCHKIVTIVVHKTKVKVWPGNWGGECLEVPVPPQTDRGPSPSERRHGRPT